MAKKYKISKSAAKRLRFSKRGRYKALKVIISVMVCAGVFLGGYFLAPPIIKLFNKPITEPKTNNTNPTDTDIPVTEPVTTDKTEAERIDYKSVYLPKASLTVDGINAFLAYANENSINAVVIDIKGEDGLLNYETNIEKVNEIQAVSENPVQINTVLQKLHDNGIYVIGRISCFKDNKAPIKIRSISVQVSNGGQWRHNNQRWINAYSTQGWEYLADIAIEACNLGFDEIMLAEVKFPDAGQLNLIDYKENADVKKSDALNGFINYISEKIHEKNKKVSLQIPPICVHSDGTEISGQQYEYANLKIDTLCPVFETSVLKTEVKVLKDGEREITNFENNPYEVVSLLSRLINEKSENIKVRPYLQAYNGGKTVYDRSVVDEQIKILSENNITEYVLYNKQGEYK